MSLPEDEETKPRLLKEISARISLNLKKEYRKAIFTALEPELEDMKNMIKVELLNKRQNLNLTINAKSLSNLRAALNSNFLLIKAAYDTLNILR